MILWFFWGGVKESLDSLDKLYIRIAMAGWSAQYRWLLNVVSQFLSQSEENKVQFYSPHNIQWYTLRISVFAQLP